MIPLCADQGVGLVPWSPLARGRLARPWEARSERSETDEFGKTLYGEADRPIVEAVAAVASERGVPMAQVALAWMLGKPGIAAPIVGATKLSHLDDAVGAVDVRLEAAEVARLEAAYQPHAVAGHR